MDPSDYLQLLQQARDSGYGIRLCMEGWTPVTHVRRRLYAARDRARARGDRSLDVLSVIAHDSGEIWIVRRDRLRGHDNSDDGLGAYPSALDGDEVPPAVLARGPARRKGRIPLYSRYPDGCLDPTCGIVKRFLAGEFDDVAERLAAAEAARGDPQVEAGPKLSLADAERILTHFGSRAR